MKKTIITLLATAALAAPAFAANDAATQPQQQPQAQQSQDTQQQSQAQPQNGQQQKQNQASNQEPGSAPNLSSGEVRQLQTALNKNGFNAGRPDGKLGPRTKHAVQAFDHKKGIQSSNGQPTEQTLAQLGINTNQGQQPNGNQQQPDQNSK
jgi:peptidoglycan hydrolase-like protein with peptidoglycan-binding domain